MVMPPSRASLSGTVLVRFLSSLGLSEAELSNDNFAERMSRLIGLSDSINIAQAHRNVSFEGHENPEAGEAPSDDALSAALHEDMELVRQTIIGTIDRCFEQREKPGRLRLPGLKFDAGDSGDTELEKAEPDYAPFHRFYLALQREMDYAIQPLWANTRDAVAGVSQEMAQLAAIDAALGESLIPHARDLFAEIPKLLKKRFFDLYSQALAELESDVDPKEHQEAQIEAAGKGELEWLQKFYGDMQELLFAELEVRLLPVIGLIEAIEHRLD